MLQNKIYQNFILEILKTFFIILFGLTIIAWTVRAVNFLDLIVENGYSVWVYFQYSMLNLFGILNKFIPLSFLIALIVFILKQIQENEFVILWTSGVKKLELVNLFFIISIFILFFYIILSTFITPLALNKSRNLLSEQGYNSFLPTIRVQNFSDSFSGFTFLVEAKNENQLKNVFIHDSENILKNLSSRNSSRSSTTIVAENGIVDEKKMILFNGQIITTEKDTFKNDIINFEQLNIDLGTLQTDTIKVPKLQETSTASLISCFVNLSQIKSKICKQSAKKEITTVLNRRLVLPFYIPIVSLLSSFLLIKIYKKRNYFFNGYSIFFLSFLVLLYAELIIRYTGKSQVLNFLFTASPIILIPLIYIFLLIKFSKESVSK